jgi:MFS family permease
MRGMTKNKILILIVTVLFWFCIYVYMPYQTSYLLGMGYTASLVGAVVGAYGLTQLICRIPLGIMADKKASHKAIIMLGVIFAGLASGIRLLMPNAAGFFVGSLFSGIAASSWISFLVFFTGFYEKRENQKATGIIMGLNNTGILLGFVTGALLYDSFGMKLMCILSIVFAVPAVTLCLFVKEEKRELKAGLPVKELLKVCWNKRLLVFAFISLVQQGIVMSTAMSFTTQVVKDLGADGMQIGICSIIYILVAVISSMMSSKQVFVKIGGKVCVPVILGGMILYCILVPNAVSIWQIYLLQCLAGLTQGFVFSLCTSEAMGEVEPEKKSTAMGAYQAVYAIGMTFLPMLSGKISAAFSMKTAYYVMAMVVLTALMVVVLFYRSEGGKKR